MRHSGKFHKGMVKEVLKRARNHAVISGSDSVLFAVELYLQGLVYVVDVGVLVM